jgi:hypothetical protein
MVMPGFGAGGGTAGTVAQPAASEQVVEVFLNRHDSVLGVRIAIVGAGVSGLLVGHLLHREHEITVFESAGYPGGHIRVDTPNETHAGATLEEAQVAKLELVCEKLDLRPEDHLLEIGTGWGALAVHAAITIDDRAYEVEKASRSFGTSATARLASPSGGSSTCSYCSASRAAASRTRSRSRASHGRWVRNRSPPPECVDLARGTKTGGRGGTSIWPSGTSGRKMPFV